MAGFRCVRDEEAGPQALGILVPPGRRTVVIVRPRGLPWDLLLCHNHEPPLFRELPHEAGRAAALALSDALEAWSAGGPGRRSLLPTPAGGCWLRFEIGAFALIVCQRSPGQPYQPFLFPLLEEAETTAAALQGVLCPPANGEQELYLNIRNFSR